MPDSVSVLSLVRPPLVMVVVKPVSVKIVLLSDRAKPLLVGKPLNAFVKLWFDGLCPRSGGGCGSPLEHPCFRP